MGFYTGGGGGGASGSAGGVLSGTYPNPGFGDAALVRSVLQGANGANSSYSQNPSVESVLLGASALSGLSYSGSQLRVGANVSDLKLGTSAGVLTANLQYVSAETPGSAVSGALTLDWNVGTSKRYVLSGNVTSITSQNHVQGAVYWLGIHQDATGNRTWSSLPSSWKFLAGENVLSTAANAHDYYLGFCDAGSIYWKLQGRY